MEDQSLVTVGVSQQESLPLDKGEIKRGSVMRATSVFPHSSTTGLEAHSTFLDCCAVGS